MLRDPISEPKRPRMMDNGSNLDHRQLLQQPSQQQQQQQSFGSSQPPSKVVQIRNLPEAAVEADLLDSCGQFGAISYIQMIGRGSALLEFEDCISYNSTTDIFVLQQAAYFSFAGFDEIPRKGFESAHPTKVLVMYINNARYPITADVVASICKPVAHVQRLVITRRQGIVVLAEFQDSDIARTVKQKLNGCDIYSGCCTLKIEYSRVSRLNIKRNDQDQWDFVGAMMEGAGGVAVGSGDELGYDDQGRPIYDDPYGGFSGPGASESLPPVQLQQQQQQQQQQQLQNLAPNQPAYIGAVANRQSLALTPNVFASMHDYGGQSFRDRDPFAPPGRDIGYSPIGHPDYRSPIGDPSRGPIGMGRGVPYDQLDRCHQRTEIDGTGMGFENSVLMLYGLDDARFNAERVFNMLCLYGNVVSIKFLKSKADACMVQMGDPIAADRVINNLNRALIFDKQLQFGMSKKPFLEDVRSDPYPLPDGSPSYKSFRDSRSNRYVTTLAASKNRLNPPCNLLYFFNVPNDFTEEQLVKLIASHNLAPAKSIRVFEPREGSRTCAGIAEFEHVSDAMEVVAMCNHEIVKSETSRSPFLIKFTFSGPHGGGLDGTDRELGRGFGSRGARDFDRGPRARDFGGRTRGRGRGRDFDRGIGFGRRERDDGVNGSQHLIRDRGGRGGPRGSWRGGSRR